jgi:hypothetical protein
MKKYVWKCEGENCGKEFIADTPDSCPNCEGDDIIIIKETGGIPSMSNTVKKILIASIVIIAIVLIWRGCNETFLPPTLNGDGSTTYTLKKVDGDNFFKIKGAPDKHGLYVEDVSSGERLYADGNTFYPCSSGIFEIIFEEEPDSTIKFEPEFKMGGFFFSMEGIAHKNACKDQLKIHSVDIMDVNCTYTIMTNMDDNENIEVSLKESNGYIKKRLIWTYEQVGSASSFYVRINGTGQKAVKYPIQTCVLPPQTPKISPEEVVSSFDLYLLDINNNRKQFQDLLKDEPDIYFNGQDQEVGNFIMHLETELDNGKNLKEYSLSESDIEYGGDDKIIRLKITQSLHEH